MLPQYSPCACGCGQVVKPGSRFVRGHNQRLRAHLPRKRTPADERFWRKVEKTPTCWLWQGGTNGRGYGTFGDHYTHRFAYEISVGPIPDGLELDHLCRNPICCNPSHLEPVTHRENTLRAVQTTHCPNGHPYDEVNTLYKRRRDGRLSKRCRICHRDRESTRYHESRRNAILVGPTKGEAHRWAKLTEEAIVAIRATYASGGMTQKQLADRFAVDHSLISQIVKRKVWRHVA